MVECGTFEKKSAKNRNAFKRNRNNFEKKMAAKEM
jgi:hypothetical protein